MAPALTLAAPSPCTGVCQLAPDQPLCLGCGRTADEIARWPSASAAEQREILSRLPARLASRASG